MRRVVNPLRAWRFPFFYGWIVVAVTYIVALTASGTRSAPAVFIIPFEHEFGWSRGEISGSIAVNLLLFGLGAPLSGKLMDMFGPRLVMITNVMLLTLALLATTMMTELWHLNILWGVLIGLAAGGNSVLFTAVATSWFEARRGMIIGFLGTANSTGQLIFIPLLMGLIVTMGWRGASLVMAVVAISLLVPIVLFMRREPADVGQQAYGTGTPEARRQSRGDGESLTLAQALRTPEFWLLSVCFFVCGATANGLIGVHFIPHAIDHGIPAVTAAATFGLLGGMNFVGTMISGYLTDHHDPRRLLSIYYGFRGLSLFVLPFVTGGPGLIIFAVMYGLDWFATVPPTSTITAKRFGRKSLGIIFGWIFFAHQLGAASMAYGGGVVKDLLGDYQFAFLAGGVLCLGAAGLASLIRLEHPTQTPLPVASAAAAA